MVQRVTKGRNWIKFSFLVFKIEAEGLPGIAAFLVVVALLFAGRWMGLG